MTAAATICNQTLLLWHHFNLTRFTRHIWQFVSPFSFLLAVVPDLEGPFCLAFPRHFTHLPDHSSIIYYHFSHFINPKTGLPLTSFTATLCPAWSRSTGNMRTPCFYSHAGLPIVPAVRPHFFCSCFYFYPHITTHPLCVVHAFTLRCFTKQQIRSSRDSPLLYDSI
jgi:hypothetical protein